MKKLLLIIFFFFAWTQNAGATAYYIDFQATYGTFDGLATTTPFTSLDAYMEVARSAGDIAFVRRNKASTTNVTDINPASDGTMPAPIIVSADNDNLWGDASTTAQTYTVSVGNQSFTGSATITGMQAGDWFYVEGDCTQTYNSTTLNQCEFFYEVASISGTVLNLYLPYKGNQTGAGNSLVNLGKNPQWNIASGDFQWNFDTDNFWVVKGMDVRGTDGMGQVEIDSSVFHSFIDCIIIGDSATTLGGIVASDDSFSIYVTKTRISGYTSSGIALNGGADTYGALRVIDSRIDGAGVANVYGIDMNSVTSGAADIFVKDTYFSGQTGSANADFGDTGPGSQVILRNVRTNSTEQFFVPINESFWYIEDRNTGTPSEIGRNTYFNAANGGSTGGTFLGNSDKGSMQSTSTVLRSGGGSVSTQIVPTTNTGSIWDFHKIKLFEYPIYANTASKQYDVYFKSTSTAAWTADPLATELWIECEYWAHQTGATSTRKITKSTGVLDFNGSTDWAALSVTCVPTQSGILYLRGWYGKTKEASKMNEFFVDGKPVIQ